jgi:hypothetical protein
MERERWEKVYQLLQALDTHAFRGVYQAGAVLAVFFWAVIHDRPVSWACERANWDRIPFRLPSQATMSRRLRQADVLELLATVGKAPAVVGSVEPTCIKYIDGKPLAVGGCSHDCDARWGHGAGGIVRGYKFFAIWGRGPLPIAWQIAAMNVSEESMATKLIAQLSGGGGYLLGDSIYDVNRLYDLALGHGHQLIAPKKRRRTGLGHRRHSPARLRSIELLQTPFGKQLYGLRTQIERNFGNLTNFGGGLSPLPAWVRRQYRVEQWVRAKLVLSALRDCYHRPMAVE